MPDVNKIIGDVTNTIDDNVYSRQEQEEDRTERLKIDLQSDSWLAKSVRPILAIVILSVWSGAHVASIWKPELENLLDSVNAVMMVVLGFYFVSRGLEKISTSAAQAKIKIERLRTRAELRQERRESRK